MIIQLLDMSDNTYFTDPLYYEERNKLKQVEELVGQIDYELDHSLCEDVMESCIKIKESCIKIKEILSYFKKRKSYGSIKFGVSIGDILEMKMRDNSLIIKCINMEKFQIISGPSSFEGRIYESNVIDDSSIKQIYKDFLEIAGIQKDIRSKNQQSKFPFPFGTIKKYRNGKYIGIII
jgi:hypothetical protein